MKTYIEWWNGYCNLMANRKIFLRELDKLRTQQITPESFDNTRGHHAVFLSFLTYATNLELAQFMNLLNTVNARQQDKALEEIKSEYIQVIERILQEKING